MRWSWLGVKMVRRTCLDCGETWTLETGLAHLKARPRLIRGGLAGNLSFTQRLEFGKQQLGAMNAGLDQQRETIRQLSTCPKCGGERYQDERA